MKIKKGTDILEIRDTSGEFIFVEKTASPVGKKLLTVLETIVGNPALEDSSEIGAPSISISRYRLT